MRFIFVLVLLLLLLSFPFTSVFTLTWIPKRAAFSRVCLLISRMVMMTLTVLEVFSRILLTISSLLQTITDILAEQRKKIDLMINETHFVTCMAESLRRMLCKRILTLVVTECNPLFDLIEYNWKNELSVAGLRMLNLRQMKTNKFDS